LIKRFWYELRTRQNGLLLLAVPLAALCALTLSIYSFTSQRRAADARLREAVLLHRDLETLNSDVLTADSVIRSYLLHGRDETLAPYKKVREYLPDRVRGIRRKLNHNVLQSQRWARLEPVVERHMRVLAELRYYARIPGLATPAPPEQLMLDGARAVDEIQRLLAEISQEQDSQTQQAQADVESAQHRINMILTITLAFGLVGGIVVLWLLMRGVAASERRRAETASLNSHTELQRMLERSEAQAEELARSAKAHLYQTQVLQSVLRSMSDGLVVAGEDGGILMCNEAANHILEGLANTPISNWITRYGLCLSDGKTPCPTDQLPLVRALGGEEIELAVLFAERARNSGAAWLSMTARPMRDESGKVKGGVVVVADITELKRNEEVLSHAKEQAEHANRAKSEFVSRMSHELRTPLNTILGFGQRLEMAGLDSARAGNLDHILTAGRHLLTLINEVLDISRIEAGRLSLSLEPVLVAELIEEALAMVAPLAAAREVQITEESGDAEVYVLADRQRLKQVLLNLLSNAVKYNQVRGTVSVSCQDNGYGLARLRVSDSGQGISAEKMDLLFNPFERLGAEQTDVEGTGIGLVLSKRLVELMAGRIGVESKLGTGSTFWVELPVTAPPASGSPDGFTRDLTAAAGAVSETPVPVPRTFADF
jgi:signal transduction histidine kinase/CHASE3 domain sensor protein